MADIPNGGFETGTLEQWYPDSNWYVTDETSHSGTYCAAASMSGIQTAILYKYVDVTGISTLKFYLKLNNVTILGTGFIHVTVKLYRTDDVELGTIFENTYNESNMPPTGWIEISAYTMLHDCIVKLVIRVETSVDFGFG